MPAHEHLNKDQMINLYHSSWDDRPPHIYEGGTWGGNRDPVDPEDNIHPDVIHMGSATVAREMASETGREYLYMYKVHPSNVAPEVYGDSDVAMTGSNPDSRIGSRFHKKMEGVQQGLWEHISPNITDVANSGKVTAYRNQIEDPGSISHMVPKSAIHEGKVQYRGGWRVDAHGFKKPIDAED